MDPFVGEIRMFAGNFAPTGWALCNGQVMSISQNTALFSLLGTTYGGDGRSTFALPNLQGVAPMHQGQGAGLSNRSVGESGGSDAVTLLTAQMPVHTHTARGYGAAPGNATDPTGAVWGRAQNGRQPLPAYGSAAAPAAMSLQAVSAAGGSQPHNNLQPYLVLTFIIALQGVFPPRS